MIFFSWPHIMPRDPHPLSARFWKIFFFKKKRTEPPGKKLVVQRMVFYYSRAEHSSSWPKQPNFFLFFFNAPFWPQNVSRCAHCFRAGQSPASPKQGVNGMAWGVGRGEPHSQRVKSKHHREGGADRPHSRRSRRAAWANCTQMTAWQQWPGVLSSGKSRPGPQHDEGREGLRKPCVWPRAVRRWLPLHSNAPLFPSQAPRALLDQTLSIRGMCGTSLGVLVAKLLLLFGVGVCGGGLLQLKGKPTWCPLPAANRSIRGDRWRWLQCVFHRVGLCVCWGLGRGRLCWLWPLLLGTCVPLLVPCRGHGAWGLRI